MTNIWIVWNSEEWVGTFFQAAFATKKEAEQYLARKILSNELGQNAFVSEYILGYEE